MVLSQKVPNSIIKPITFTDYIFAFGVPLFLFLHSPLACWLFFSFLLTLKHGDLMSLPVSSFVLRIRLVIKFIVLPTIQHQQYVLYNNASDGTGAQNKPKNGFKCKLNNRAFLHFCPKVFPNKK